MRPGPLAGRYPAVAAMVVLFLVPYLGLSSALQPVMPFIAGTLHMSPQAMSLATGTANAGYAAGGALLGAGRYALGRVRPPAPSLPRFLAGQEPGISRVLTGHLGPQAAELPVVGETWPLYDHVNVQLALGHWLADDGRHHQLVGLTGFQNRMFSLADLAQGAAAPHGPGIGSVALANPPCGPGAGPSAACAAACIW
ncbi:MAG TPA: hypothetical protein VKV80_07405 [Streptosporangiaceae bacterium]|nr:hypothetical protein [Streptosporangiaceae bacterium]